MKTLIKINFLVIIAIAVCNIAQAQQKASDKSYNSVLAEVKQRQAMRNRMLQQMRQTTPDNSFQNNSTDGKPTMTIPVTRQQTTVPEEGTNQQPANKQLPSKPAKASSKIKNQ